MKEGVVLRGDCYTLTVVETPSGLIEIQMCTDYTPKATLTVSKHIAAKLGAVLQRLGTVK